MPFPFLSEKLWVSPHRRSLPTCFGEKTLLMGIVNITPDSFSDGGNCFSKSAALAHAKTLVEAGADILDLGAESTRPTSNAINSEGLDVEEECSRLLPALKEIRSELPEIPISIDSYHIETLKKSIDAGADIINCVYAIGEKEDRKQEEETRLLAKFTKEINAPLIAMHYRKKINYKNFWTDFINDLKNGIDIFLDAGVEKSQLWLDPGFGFGKTPEQNLMIVARLEEIVALGYPILLGTSRKSTLGKILNKSIPKDRWPGDAACSSIAAIKGVAALRLHDIALHSGTIKVADAIWSQSNKI